MGRRNVQTKHYSLGVIFALFILIMSSIVILTLLNDSNEETTIFEEVNYGTLETINPLVIENSKHIVDKTDANVNLVSEIKRVYNLDVIYGKGTEYLAETVDAKPLYDSNDINKILLELVECLEKYPNNIFKEIMLKDYSVEICLVDYFTNDNLALATRDSNNNFKVYLSHSDNREKIEKAVHHETYHILEYYMKLEYDINDLYRDWVKYNPEGFEYQPDVAALDKNYVLNYDPLGRNYFVTIYSKVSEKEDRAEVFADTMISGDKDSII